VPVPHVFWQFIETLARIGITSGCAVNPARYCPDSEVTRAQMAVFLLKGAHGPDFVPPAPTVQTFTDVPLNHPFAPWIYQLAAEGITGGCAVNPSRYCPDQSVTRAQMAVFLLKAKNGPTFTPPAPAAQTFADVPLNNPFAVWIYQLAADGITGGCAVNPARYCPDQAVTRGQMAVFLVRTFDLPLQP
jgi:S-layer homology domain